MFYVSPFHRMLLLVAFSWIAAFLYFRFGIFESWRTQVHESEAHLATLRQREKSHSAAAEALQFYQKNLMALDLVLRARRQVENGSDPESPHLVFDFPRLLDDLRRILPRDARATRFSVTPKGLLTLSVESSDYASLGRVLRSFKDSPLFREVRVPSGAQRSLNPSGLVYSFLLQAQLDPVYHSDPS